MADKLTRAGYSFTVRGFSELTAAAAPTRHFLIHVSGIPYNLLVIAFACGIWIYSKNAPANERLRAISVLIRFGLLPRHDERCDHQW